MIHSTVPALTLSLEGWNLITRYLTQRDVAELSMTCRALHELSLVSEWFVGGQQAKFECLRTFERFPADYRRVLRSLYLNGRNIPEFRFAEVNRGITDLHQLSSCHRLRVLELVICSPLHTTGISSLTELQELRISGWGQLMSIGSLAACTTLVHPEISLGGGCVDSIEPLSSLSALHTLILSVGSFRVDLTPLGALHALHTLKLVECESFTSIDPLTTCTALSILKITRCTQLHCVASLADLTSLHTLEISNFYDALNPYDHSPPPPLDLNPFSSCQALASVSITDYESLEEIVALGNCPTLQRLTLYNCRSIRTFASLAHCHALKTLDVRYTNIDDLTVLQSKANLSTLKLSRCHRIADISPLATCPLLTSLYMDDLQLVTSIAPLAACQELTKLDISRCSIADIDVLASLHELRLLHMSSCTGITQIDALASCSKLIELCLSKCSNIVSIAPLAAITGLRYLMIGECQSINDINPLAGCQSLQTLKLNTIPKSPT